MTKIRTPSPLSEATRLHPSILPAGTPIQRAVAAVPTQNQSQRKPRRPLSEDEARLRAAEREEMQSLLAKLKQLVPGIPKRRKLTKLEIIQHVIDYIFDLQVALESHPISSANQAVTTAAMEFINFQIAQQHAQQQHQNPDFYQPESNSNTSPCDLAYQMIAHHQQQEPIRISNQAPARTSERQPLASIML